MATAPWTDDPTRSGSEDGLGRLPYAERAADLIAGTHSFDTSVVFGLSGPWGSGKTSMVNMIVERVERTQGDWVVARFTPWATGDTDSLVGEFYASLSAVLPPGKGGKAIAALSKAARIAAPLTRFIPYGGDSAAEAIKMAVDAIEKNPPWQVAYEEASAELKELRKPVLVVVDDIDRLHEDELLVLMKVVRLLGRFNGMQYLLAYDDETLYRNLQTAGVSALQDGTPERFMEKIVQYPLFVPPLLRHQQITRLNDGFAAVSDARSGSDLERVRSLFECFLALLTTPRAIDRYIAQLVHHVPLLPENEIDDEDVYLLTLIRVAVPRLYNALYGHRTELITGTTGRMDPADWGKHQRFDATDLVGLAPAKHREIVRLLLESLFPKIADEGVNFAHPSRGRQSVQEEDYFDRYFAMGILENDIPDFHVADALADAADGEVSALATLFESKPQDNWTLMLSKIAALAVPTGDAERRNLAAAAALLARDLPSSDHGPFTPRDQALHLTAQQIVGIDRDASPTTVATILNELGDLGLQIRVWRTVADQILQTYRDHPPTWFAETHSRLLEENTASVVDHLLQRDEAPVDVAIGSRIAFALRYDPEPLVAGVRALFDEGHLTVDTLASRCVGVLAGRHGPDLLNEDIYQDVFDQIAPPGDDPWYSEPPEEGLDLTDLSWANRRRFATGRFVPPRRRIS